jgi:predicted DNA-binding transcriptional regulator AlpA
MADLAPAAPSELLDRTALAAMLCIGTSTFDRLRAAGKIGPRPVRLGGAIRWHRGEVLAWLAHRDPAGGLCGAEAWPPVWDALRRRNPVK